MKLERGKKYKDRRGNMVLISKKKTPLWEWPFETVDGETTYREDGTAGIEEGEERPWDIVEEWKEEEQTNEIKAIQEERVKDYGDPKKSHANIGLMWSAFLRQKGIKIMLQPEDVAMMMVLFKATRESFKHKDDNVLDLKSYLDLYEKFIGG